MSFLHTLKSAIPRSALQPYHYVLARAAALWYGNPSRKLVVIGVTGTKGKSSTVQMIAQLLTACGEKVGYTSTAGFCIAGEEIPNRMKMTMPGRLSLQRMVRDMVRAGCRYAIVETSSQGLVQFRHIGLNYDVAVFTNLTPEHIESHGGFENYRAAKGLLFAHLMRRPHKRLHGTNVQKSIVLNADDPHAGFFGAFPADRYVQYGWEFATGVANETTVANLAGTTLAPHDDASERIVLCPTAVTRDTAGLHMTLNGVKMDIPLFARFEQQNAFCAIATLRALGIDMERIGSALSALRSIPGRFERILCGQPFTVVVDYAYEPASIAALIAAVRDLGARRILGVHGSAGGGRDVARREKIGRLAGQEEDLVFVTNEDPYDDDPEEIIRMVAEGARAEGKRDGETLFTITDRAAAIRAAVHAARPGDVVLVTGKGSEPVMAVAGGKTIPWDDRACVRSALAEEGYAL